jgi:hypothetical protein
MYRITRSQRRAPRATPPTRLFPVAYCKQKTLHESTLGPPLRHAWVALGPRLGHPNPIPVGRGSQRTLPLPLCRPNLTQGHPGRPKVLGWLCQIPRAHHQGLSFAGSFFCQRSSTAQLFRSGANLQLYHSFACGVKKKRAFYCQKIPPQRKKCPPTGWSKPLGLR